MPQTRDFLDTFDLHSVEEMFGRIGKEERKRCCSLNAVWFQWHLQRSRKKFYSFTSKMEFRHIGFCVQVTWMCTFIITDAHTCTQTQRTYLWLSECKLIWEKKKKFLIRETRLLLFSIKGKEGNGWEGLFHIMEADSPWEQIQSADKPAG